MKHRINLFRIGVCIFATLLTSSCNTSEARPQPSVEPYVPPVANASPTNTPLPPLPDFPSDILFFGFGGGGGGIECGEFSSIPSVLGGTTYPTGPADLDPTSTGSGLRGDADTYSHGAELCLAGIPKDKPIQIKFTSPNQTVTLSTTVQVVDDPDYPGNFAVRWAGYPDTWGKDGTFLEGYWLVAGAGRQGGQNSDLNKPIMADFALWWPGGLENGLWKVEASWTGQTVYGSFDAKTHSLPELSFGDPGFDTKLFPVINSYYPYVCRLAPSEPPFFAVLATFPPNAPVYILIYGVFEEGSMRQSLSLVYSTVIYSDDRGAGRIELPDKFGQNTKYYLFGTTNPAVQFVGANNSFNISTIANAMDCFVIPPKQIPTDSSTAKIFSSCPGAPPQRFAVGIPDQFGFVCTKSAAIRLRTAPSLSASVIDSVPPGTRFDIVGGRPFCSDNLSWWYVDTFNYQGSTYVDGPNGWVSEGGDEVDQYFICPD